MTENEALNILVQVALKAQSVGALKLEESVLVKEAIDTFQPKEQSEEKKIKPQEEVEEKVMPIKGKTTEGAF